MKIPLMKQIAVCLVLTVFVLGFAPAANASMVSSAMIAKDVDREADLDTIQNVLEQKVVKQRLLDYGFTEEEVKERLANLTDEEVNQLAMKADEVHVGGDSGLVLVLILALAVVIYLLVADKKVVVKDR